jgi:hypothetical protein
MTSFILVPYYNTIPKNISTYFTIADNTLTVSLTDIFGNSSTFLSTALNKIVYIFNGPNMGTFTINSLNSSNNKTYTLGIKLNSVPPNLEDNTYCVLSLVPSVYTINRTFASSIGDFDNGTFTLSNNNTILINKTSISSNDTLFIYILITNKSFNIINDISSAYYVINDVIISPNQPNNAYISINASIPIMSLVDGSSYEFNISTSDARTVSNVTINNTTALPINSPRVNLIQTNNDTTYTPGYSPSISTRVNIPTYLVDHSNNLNMMNNTLKKSLEYNNSVLLTYTSKSFYGNGYFTITSVSPDLIDLYANLKKYPATEHFDYSLTAKTGYDKITNFFKKTYDNIVATGAGIVQDQIQPDVISRVELIFGDRYTFKVSSIDSYKKQVNFIKQHSLLFLTSGTNIYMMSTNTIPINTRNASDTIIEFNVFIDKPLPIESINKSYVLSTTPILPYVTFEYSVTHIISNVIPKGTFTKLSLTATNKLPTIVISNYESYYNYDVSSFNSLLCTIVQDSSQKLTPPYLNILNASDYSLICTLAVLHAVPDVQQTTFTYSIVSGASNFYRLFNKTKYIITLLSPTDFISEDGVINLTQKMKPELIRVNNIIQNTKTTIDKIVSNKPNYPELIIAKSIITDTSKQSTILSNMPITHSIADLSESLLANTYNAIQFGLKADPTNPDFLLLKDSLFNKCI